MKVCVYCATHGTFENAAEVLRQGRCKLLPSLESEDTLIILVNGEDVLDTISSTVPFAYVHGPM